MKKSKSKSHASMSHTFKSPRVYGKIVFLSVVLLVVLVMQQKSNDITGMSVKDSSISKTISTSTVVSFPFDDTVKSILFSYEVRGTGSAEIVPTGISSNAVITFFSSPNPYYPARKETLRIDCNGFCKDVVPTNALRLSIFVNQDSVVLKNIVFG